MVNEMVAKDNTVKPHITKNTDTEPFKKPQNNNVEDKCLDDITEIDLKK